MMRALSLSLLAAAAVAALAGPADADHRWYHRHIFFPLTEVFPGGWNDEDDYADQNGQDDGDASVPRQLQRNLRAEDKWWIHGNAQNLEPTVQRKPAAKKVTVSKIPPKPVLKPEPQTIATSAAVAAEPVAPHANLATASTAKIDAKPAVTTAAMPAPVSKGIGCTAGAAIVTNYGFADVKPKTCDGDTFAYTASRGGKSFIIKLTASSGEVVDVKKL
jgi:hypothetical protein